MLPEWRLTVIVASTREGRIGPTVASWFVDEVRRSGRAVVRLVDLAETEVPSDRFASAVATAHAVVIVTPEYNHSFPGPLKTALDSLRAEWRTMPVGFVSYGGVSGGVRAVEALRVVFAELHAVTVRETVSLPLAWDKFDTNGRLRDPARLPRAVERLLDQLEWWSAAVCAGRRLRQYAE